MHSGEEPAAGLVRELREETGIVLQTSDVRLLATEPFARHGFQYTNHYFVTEVSEKPLVGKLPFEITATAWKPLAEVRTGRGYGAEVLRALRLLDSQP